MRRQLPWMLTSCVMLIGLLSGCRSITPNVTYYVMRPISSVQTPPADTGSHRSMIVGIRTVELPGYINRTQMVRRSGENQMDVADFHRWVDYPDRMVPRILGENLQRLLPGVQVYNIPWPVHIKPDVIVAITFLELIGTTEKKMLLSAAWTIAEPSDGPASQFHRTALSESIQGAGFDDLAAAHSRILETLCREVADSLTVFQTQ